MKITKKNQYDKLPCDKVDSDLFHASMVVSSGKGNKASFCCSSWINGVAATVDKGSGISAVSGAGCLAIFLFPYIFLY